ncbi:MAG: TIGR03960 family B12-binding radical SAM protein [Desulfovibrionaceae bacterium]
MKHLLTRLPRPSRYLGNEWGALRKEAPSLRVALAFPDLYEVGMSYLGQKILYEAVNRVERFAAERVYAPCEEAAGVLRASGALLATLESDTPLAETDAVAFSLTHELCYTNVLYMLELGGIPLKAAERTEAHPLVMAGGGACFGAEPLADYLDLMVLGDGEEVIVTILEHMEAARDAGRSRRELLEELRHVPGVYVPAFFEFQGPGEPLAPLFEDYTSVEKAIVDDLDAAPFPTAQPVSPGQAVHDRLTLEIARGCTRGCRFCQAGMIYRPVRERSVSTIERQLAEGLAGTGCEEISFLSLSTGDYSALEGLFTRTFDRCAAEQVSISLPSLRVGSISEAIMERISSIRRTGATLAPEAGSQRLRDVINKGVTEEGLLAHVEQLFEKGWQGVKLYFMIGLPTETDEDLAAIADLCLKVREVGRHTKRLQVTAAISPFVPKPHTPFQWEEQASHDEILRRIDLLYDLFRPHKRLRLKTHIPRMSWLEGVFSRGDRRLGPVVERAYRAGALFSSWKDHLDLAPYQEAMAAEGLTFEEYLAERDPEAPLPWDHLRPGVRRSFLLKERERALVAKTTDDCRYHACRNCGVCGHDGHVSTLTAQCGVKDIRPRVLNAERDQAGNIPEHVAAPPPAREQLGLSAKGSHLRLWFEKTGPAAYLSQLELQSVFERALRRAGLPASFSEGFHPMPRLSFGRALPVGVESRCEWINVMFREEMTPQEAVERLAGMFPGGLRITRAEPLSMGRKQPQPAYETYAQAFPKDEAGQEAMRAGWETFLASASFPVERQTKRGTRTDDLRPLVREAVVEEGGVRFAVDWTETYLSPLVLAQRVSGADSTDEIALTKTAQSLEPTDL